ncbi:PAS domain-containing protein [Colwellia sp. TT2012]|uniref:PAS domain-containing protein n=1 Tax=Colwellia sp. TT2012 TaxID=1720342 RepID=UPI00070DB14E|nr:PAS domain-containing protein [Colwellia sp. TT2012]
MKYLERDLLLNSVINLIDDLIFYKDKDFKYIGCNTAFLHFINISADKLIGKNDFEIFDHDLASLFRHHDKLMLAEGK